MIKILGRKNIAELTDQIKANLNEDSYSPTKNDSYKRRSLIMNGNRSCTHSDSNDNGDFSKSKNIDEVSISLLINDENLATPSSPLKHHRAKSVHDNKIRMSQLKDQSFSECANSQNSSTCHNNYQNKEKIDRLKFFKSICAKHNIDFSENSEPIKSKTKPTQPNHRRHRSRRYSLSSSNSFTDQTVQKNYNNLHSPCGTSEEDLFQHSDEFFFQMDRLGKHRADIKHNQQKLHSKKAKIQSLLYALSMFQNNQSDSDSSDDISLDKLRIINQLITKRKKKEKKKIKLNNFQDPYPMIESSKPLKYNSYGLIRYIPTKYSRPKLPPTSSIFFKDETSKNDDLISKKAKSKDSKRSNKQPKKDKPRSDKYKIPYHFESSYIAKTDKTVDTVMNSDQHQNVSIFQEEISLNVNKIMPQLEEVVKEEKYIHTEDEDSLNVSVLNREHGKEESEKKIELEKTDKSKEVIPNKVEMISSRFSVIEDHPNDPSKVEEKKTDSSFQKIARQTRITFFNDNLKAEKPKYEANLPHLPAEVNLNVTSNLNNNVDNNKFVDSGKTQQLNKIKFTGKLSPSRGSPENLSVIAEETENYRSSNSLNNLKSDEESTVDRDSLFSKKSDDRKNNKNSSETLKVKSSLTQSITEYDEVNSNSISTSNDQALMDRMKLLDDTFVSEEGEDDATIEIIYI